MITVPLEGASAKTVRAYGLRSPKRAVVYLHHAACAECQRPAPAGQSPAHRWDHDRGLVTGLTLRLDVPQNATGYWYDPSKDVN